MLYSNFFGNSRRVLYYDCSEKKLKSDKMFCLVEKMCTFVLLFNMFKNAIVQCKYIENKIDNLFVKLDF